MMMKWMLILDDATKRNIPKPLDADFSINRAYSTIYHTVESVESVQRLLFELISIYLI